MRARLREINIRSRSSGWRKILCGVLVGCLGYAGMGYTMDIVAGGEPRAVIVLPDLPTAVAEYAAKELQSHIALATGATLEIVPEKDAAGGMDRIYVGPCEATKRAGIQVDDLPVNASVRKVTQNAMFLVGKDGDGVPPGDDATSMGSLFAVYDWLGDKVGACWLWPGESGTVVARTKDLAGGQEGEETVQPTLMHSRIRNWFGVNDMNKADRERYLLENNTWLRRHRIARGVSLEYPHAYEKYWERFGEIHPEYFALRPDGVRAPVGKEVKLVQMCVTNPGFQQQVIADWLESRKSHPTKPWINGCENDMRRGVDWPCTCEVCQAWDAVPGASEKSLSNRYARFWLALLEEGRKHDPEATVFGLAYAGYSKPPEGVQLNDKIIVGIVPPYSFPLTEESRKAMRENWEGWAKTGARLFLRPNYFLHGYCVPYIYAEEFGREFQYAYERGMVATDFDSLTAMWGVQGPNIYVLARLQEKPEMKLSAILDEFYSGFGPAAGQVRAYFDFWRDITKRRDAAFAKAHEKAGWGLISTAGDEIYTPEVFRRGYELLEEARVAATGSEDVLKRLNYLSVWLKHAELAMKTLAAFHAQKANSQDGNLKVAFAETKDALDRYRKKYHEEFAAANMALLRRLELWSGWRSAAEVDQSKMH